MGEIYALPGDVDESLCWLAQSTSCGWISYPYMAEHNRALDRLRGRPRFETYPKRDMKVLHPYRLLATALLLLCGVHALALDKKSKRPIPIDEVLQIEADNLASIVTSAMAAEFLAATQRLPDAPARTILKHRVESRYYSEAAAAALPAAERDALEPIEIEPDRFYTTKYGSPLTYCRALDIAAEYGLRTLKDTRVLDYGYGTVGQLRLMALNGADVTGVDVDTFLSALYSGADDQGPIGRGKLKGRVRLVDGSWPGEVGQQVGGGFDLFLSKNTLERGYVHPGGDVHPEGDADPTRLLKLGVDDETYIRGMWKALNRGGLVVIYNVGPKPTFSDEPRVPWSDGHFPFERSLLREVGFDVLALDINDDRNAREMARLLGWDAAGVDIDNDLVARYTVLRKPR